MRNRGADEERTGWTRIGLTEGVARAKTSIPIDRRDEIVGPLEGAEPARHDAEAVATQIASPEIEVARFLEESGREIVALIDSTGRHSGGTAVVLQNGWGQTKEALLPLARTLVTTFGAHDEPLTVVRFDGVQKRGESEKDAPSPWLSFGASVEITVSDGPWVAEHRSEPS